MAKKTRDGGGGGVLGPIMIRHLDSVPNDVSDGEVFQLRPFGCGAVNK